MFNIKNHPHLVSVENKQGELLILFVCDQKFLQYFIFYSFIHLLDRPNVSWFCNIKNRKQFVTLSSLNFSLLDE